MDYKTQFARTSRAVIALNKLATDIPASDYLVSGVMVALAAVILHPEWAAYWGQAFIEEHPSGMMEAMAADLVKYLPAAEVDDAGQ